MPDFRQVESGGKCRPVDRHAGGMQTATAIAPTLLLGPGPSNVPPEVLAVLGQPMLGHLDARFIAIMERCKARLRQAMRTANPVTFPVSGTGSAGMEAVLVNCLEPGDTAVVGAVTVDSKDQITVTAANKIVLQVGGSSITIDRMPEPPEGMRVSHVDVVVRLVPK